MYLGITPRGRPTRPRIRLPAQEEPPAPKWTPAPPGTVATGTGGTGMGARKRRRTGKSRPRAVQSPPASHKVRFRDHENGATRRRSRCRAGFVRSPPNTVATLPLRKMRMAGVWQGYGKSVLASVMAGSVPGGWCPSWTDGNRGCHPGFVRGRRRGRAAELAVLVLSAGSGAVRKGGVSPRHVERVVPGVQAGMVGVERCATVSRSRKTSCSQRRSC